MSKIQYYAATGHKSKKGWRKCLHKTSSCKIQRWLDEKSLHIRCSNIWSDLSTLFSRMLYNSTIFINYNFHSWGSIDPSTLSSWLPDSRGGVPNCKGILLRQGVLMWSSMQNFAVWFKCVVAHEEQTDPQPHPIPLYTHSYTRLCSPLLNRLKLLIEKRFCCVLGLELDKIGFSFEQ